jgi:hypothetical protein
MTTSTKVVRFNTPSNEKISIKNPKKKYLYRFSMNIYIKKGEKYENLYLKRRRNKGKQEIF